MEDLLSLIDEGEAHLLQGIAALAARSGEPLTAMRLLQALAVRCARDPAARMHVCTALHARNDFCTLYIRLHCCVNSDAFFALFAEAQRAYGTRVFSGVTFRGVYNCVCVVTMYRVCVLRVVAGNVSVVRAFVTREVNVRGADALFAPCILDHIARMQALPLPPGAEELLLPALTSQVLLPLSAAILDRAGALEELMEVLSPLHPLTLNSSPDPLQEWFPLFTPAWCTRVVLAFQLHHLGPTGKSRESRAERCKCCIHGFFFFCFMQFNLWTQPGVGKLSNAASAARAAMRSALRQMRPPIAGTTYSRG
jgi:hypothetical protein